MLFITSPTFYQGTKTASLGAWISDDEPNYKWFF